MPAKQESPQCIVSVRPREAGVTSRKSKTQPFRASPEKLHTTEQRKPQPSLGTEGWLKQGEHFHARGTQHSHGSESPEPSQAPPGSHPAPPVLFMFHHEAAMACKHITGLAKQLENFLCVQRTVQGEVSRTTIHSCQRRWRKWACFAQEDLLS